MQFLTLEDFAPHLNETFAVDVGDGHARFTLIEAKPLPAPPEVQGKVRAPFSLLFLNSAAVLFPQRLYQMQHDGVGGFGIFLVPVARNRDGFVYQAVFN